MQTFSPSCCALMNGANTSFPDTAAGDASVPFSPTSQKGPSAPFCAHAEREEPTSAGGESGPLGTSSLSPGPSPHPSHRPRLQAGLASPISHLGLPPSSPCVSFRALLWGPARAHGAGTTRGTPFWLRGWYGPRCLWREKGLRGGDSPHQCPEPACLLHLGRVSREGSCGDPSKD